MTICAADRDYVLQRINGTEPPHVKRANEALEQMVAALVPIISGLHPKDLEILVDLIFRNGGWNRIGVVGETEPDIDLALESPVTGERIAVQVKSRASPGDYQDYRKRYARMVGFNRFYFVTHSPDADALVETSGAEGDRFHVWGPRKLADYAARNGLVGWLIDKTSWPGSSPATIFRNPSRQRIGRLPLPSKCRKFCGEEIRVLYTLDSYETPHE